MKKIMLLLCCSLIPWIARGQAAYDWYYWFDSDDAIKTEGNSIGNSFSIITDVKGLSQGFHTIHVQVVDTAGVYSPPKTEYFYHTTDRSVVALRYWFDNDMEHMQKVSASGSNYTVDVSSLEPGLHYIYCQIEDASGNVSDVVRSGFYRQIRPTAMTWTYWFDETESSKATVKYPGEAVMVDVSDLTDGFHTIHSQVQEITPSSVETRMFIKTPQTEVVGNMTCICTIDGNLVAQEEVPAQGGIMRWEMDVDSLDVGIHKAMFQAITPSGAASSIAERYFVRAITNKELGSMKCVYSLDNFKTSAQAGTLSNGLFHFDLDVSAMEDGLHRLAYMLVSENGVTTPQKTAFFWKTPLGGSGITQYDYWLNESKNVHSVTLDKRTNPFSLVKLLPVETEPIRSSCFQFEVKDGRPMLYAKNDFHIAFYDVTGRQVDESKQYVDYNTSAAITDVAQLKSTQTFTRPEENGIKWFKFEAAPGDTIGFKASQATTVQVFAPSGKEILSAMGDKSVQYSGAHTWEDGTYYVAVHDVTGSKPSVTLDYMHMDKYDVVSQDVRVVGNGGCSTITFQGNGFRDLYDVELNVKTDDGTNILHPVDINHISDAEVGITFDFSKVVLKFHPGIIGSGTAEHPIETNSESYWESAHCSATFHFTEGEKKISNAITVEEAKDIELATKVSYPSTFLRGTSVTYTVEITNKGNMNAYCVPIFTYVTSPRKNSITRIKYEGLDLPNVFDAIEYDSLSTEEITAIEDFKKSMDDDLYFIKSTVPSENNPYDSVFVRSNYFMDDFAPYETKTYLLHINTSDVVQVYVTVPDGWNEVATYSNAQSRAKGIRKASLKDEYCCIAGQLECILSTTGYFLDMASALSIPISAAFGPEVAAAIGIADCSVGIADATNRATQAIACDPENAKKSLKDKLKSVAKASASTAATAALSCVSAKLGTVKNYLKQDIQDLRTVWSNLLSSVVAIADNAGGGTSISCESMTKPKPGCPPNPPKGGGSSPVNSYDPNEIYGYIAPSGSMYVGDEVLNMPYRIEFENDTTFATSSAHKVVVKDTLDAKVFDLASYQPTSIKIGDKDVQLNGDKEFVTTVDMRPAINAIAQVEGKYDEKKGIATWQFTSLDPMTMEPTYDIMQGFLPVNYDGTSGIGEVLFNINLKQRFEEGTEIPNRASIIFDVNDPIMTPTWINIIDATPPTSHVTNVEMKNDSTLTINFTGEDNLSGVWHYDVYYRWKDNMDWICIANGCDSTAFDKTAAFGYKYEFCVLATDSAGNVEQKELAPEFEFYTGLLGDVNKDGEVTVADVSGAVSIILEEPGTEAMNAMAADVNRDGNISVADASGIVSIILGLPLESKARRVMAMRGCDLIDIAPIAMDYGETLSIPVSTANGNSNYVAMQFDLTLPQGVELVGVKGTNEHSCRMATLASGKKRVVCLSQRNETMTAQSLILVLKSSDKAVAGTIDIDGIELVGSMMNASHPEAISIPICVGDATSIDIVNGDGQDGTTYDLSGRKVRDAQKGVYIQDGKPVYIDK